MKNFTALFLMLAVFAASLVNSVYAGEQYAHQQQAMAQAAGTHCATLQMHGGKVQANNAATHDTASGKASFKGLCEMVCHAPLMVQTLPHILVFSHTSTATTPLALAQGLVPSWLAGVPDQPPKHA